MILSTAGTEALKMSILKESVGSVVATFLGVAVGAGAAIGQAAPEITIVESFYAAAGGLMGGLFFVRWSPTKLAGVDAWLAVFVSTLLGFSFGPALALFVAHETGVFSSSDLMFRIPVGAMIGAFVPILFPLFVAGVAALKSNPASLGEFLQSVKEFLPAISIRGGGGKNDAVDDRAGEADGEGGGDGVR